MTSTIPPDESAARAEALVPRFKFERLLNLDQAGRRISLLGNIDSEPGILLLERAAFPTDANHLSTLPTSLVDIKNLGANDIYSWFLASSPPTPSTPNLKLNLIYPCTPAHIKKYTSQSLRIVLETPSIYKTYMQPYMSQKREAGALNWIFNILEGRTEQEQVIYRAPNPDKDEGFLLLPDLNWDRKTMGSLHLLGLVERRDLWSLRDLRKEHVGWVKHMRDMLLEATVKLYPELERDQLKLYVHYQPTYYHFHIHIVHVNLESGSTQATGKALGLENIISQLETIQGGPEAGMADVSLSYHLGEASELWEKIYLPLKEGRSVEL
ncbi:scavenger mRNA decapping enzyme [Pleomassaria siparia CBS 279.74]|uniref:Scavenger mRNA decapping enzyme n=1 Tax=Pleomassaria siparia CBS 279.74 TaxID=1314801 RepID=A0A6G1K7M2_9PLEO|nr:scavenger mRNA decapping enzyme [Pleomassaria siparia CBS 279.74]